MSGRSVAGTPAKERSRGRRGAVQLGSDIVGVAVASVGSAGAIAQTLAPLPLSTAALIALTTLLVLVPMRLMVGGAPSHALHTSGRFRQPPSLTLVGASVLSALGLSWSAWNYSGRTEYLVSLFPQFEREDNAKWVNVVSDISNGGTAGFDLIGGVVTAFLFVCQLVARAVVWLNGSATATIGESVAAVAFAQWLLIIAAPLALLPVVRHRNRAPGSTLDLGVSTAFGGILLATGSFMAAAFGHLTAQLVIVGLAFAGARAAATEEWSSPSASVTRILTLLVLSTWLPLQPIALIASLALAIRCAKALLSGAEARVRSFAECWFALSIGTSLIPSIKFIALAEADGELAAAGGATNAAHPALLTIFGIVLALVAILLGRTTHRGVRLVVFGLVGLTAYSLVLRFNDFRVTGTLNYGSTKFVWVLAVLGTAVGVVVLARDVHPPQVNGHHLGVGLAVVLLSVPTLGSTEHLMQWVKQFDAQRWPSPVGGRWYSPEQLPMNTRVSESPVGCVVKDALLAPVPPSYTLDSYLCTRFLASAAGLEREMGPLMRFGLGRTDWAAAKSEVDLDELGGRSIVVLDQGSAVLGSITLSELVELSEDLTELTVDIVATLPPEARPGGAEMSVEEMDESSGAISGWASTSVVKLEVLVENPVGMSSFSTPRLPRPDVASAIGSSALYSGFAFVVDPATYGQVLCISATAKSGESVVVYSRTGEC